jgi:hypothetical protein
MKTVGVRQLKEHLSRYLKRVKRRFFGLSNRALLIGLEGNLRA